MGTEVAVVIPYYHNDLTVWEEISFRNCVDILRDHTIILLIPEKIVDECIPEGDILYEVVPDTWLESVASYNQVMVCEDFYRRFGQYEYILIFQLDAFVFKDLLMWFCSLEYDYIGAPWIHGSSVTLNGSSYYVGNGGLSLRRVSAFQNVLQSNPIGHIDVPEDVFWASRASEHFKIAPVDVALKFAFEIDARQCYSMNHCELPFGCHAWTVHDFDFWQPLLEDYLDKKLQEWGNGNPQWLDVYGKDIGTGIYRLSENKEQNEIYIWGAGRVGWAYCWLLRRCGKPVIACIDNNKKLWGKSILGVQIVAPDTVKTMNGRGIVIITAKNGKEEILMQLNAYEYRGKAIFDGALR